MVQSSHCDQCGAEVPGDAPQGLCPNCVLAAGFPTDGGSLGGMESAFSATMDAKFVPPQPEELAPHFPDLEIIELLGRGGMGVVYKARQKRLDRLVALKILAPKIAQDPAFAERFAREARALAMLSHANIVAVHDFGQTSFPLKLSTAGTDSAEQDADAADRPSDDADDASTSSDGGGECPLYYFVMEYVDGVNLRRLLDTGKIAPQQALEIVPQICTALQFAHDAGVVHRDIKPENILLDKRGQVKIADFGIAKLMGSEATETTEPGSAKPPSDEEPVSATSNLTAAGQVIGTPQYMAPEQIDNPQEVDHRADIYSLGVVFYQMLTGELPTGKFAPPSKKVQIDVRLDEVVLRAMEKEPERRYQQVSQIKTGVEEIVATPMRDVSDDQSDTQNRPKRWQDITKNPEWCAKFAAAWVAFAVMFIAPQVMLGHPPRQIGTLGSLLWLFCLTAPIGVPLIGIISLWKIRRTAGSISGIGWALFDILLFPLLILNGAIGWQAYQLVKWNYFPSLMEFVGPVSDIASGVIFWSLVLVPTLALSLLIDLAIILWAWPAANRLRRSAFTVGNQDSLKSGDAGAHWAWRTANRLRRFAFTVWNQDSLVSGDPGTHDKSATLSAIDDAAVEQARAQVKGPAIGLLVTGILNLLATPLIVLTFLFWSFEAVPNHVGQPSVEPSILPIILLIAAVVLVPMMLSTLIIVAALKMKRLQAYGLAISASILGIVSPVCLIGLPIGIWALVVLSQREVRAAFAQERLMRCRSDEPTEVTPWSLKAVPWQIWVVVAFLALEGVGNLTSIPTQPQAAVWFLAKCLFVVGLLRAWKWVFVLFLIEAAIHVVGFLIPSPPVAVVNLLLMGLSCWAYRHYFPVPAKSSAQTQGFARNFTARDVGMVIFGLIVLFLGPMWVEQATRTQSDWRMKILGHPTEETTGKEVVNVTKYPGGPWVAKLPQGQIELVAISHHPSHGEPWWRPDGSPLVSPPFDDHDGPHVFSDIDRNKKTVYELITRMDLPKGASPLKLRFDPSTSSSGVGKRPRRDGRELEGYRRQFVSFPKSSRTASFIIGVATGAWQPIVARRQIGSAITYADMHNEDWNISHPFLDPMEAGKSIIVSIVYSVKKDYETRIVAVDEQGQEHIISENQQSRSANSTQLIATFTNLQMKQIKEFRFQARPYKWVEFRNFSLQIGQKADVQVVPPVDKRATSGTGRASDAPRGTNGTTAEQSAAQSATEVVSSTDGNSPKAGEQAPFQFSVIIAQHVMLLDGKQIVTWPQIEEMIAKRPNPSQTRPSFFITRGAMEAGRHEPAKKEIWRLARDYKLVGHVEGSLPPRDDYRYDRVRTTDDLKAVQPRVTPGMTSLAEAVGVFNYLAERDAVGKTQPPLTEDEVIAALRWSLLDPRKLPVSDKTLQALRKITESHELPPGFELEVLTGFEPNNRMEVTKWSVRLRIPAKLQGTTCISIREQPIRSRLFGEEERKVIDKWQKKWQAEGMPLNDLRRGGEYEKERAKAAEIDRSRQRTDKQSSEDHSESGDAAKPDAPAEDMQAYLQKTKQLVRQHKDKEALERFIWFHEHALEHEPSMSGVRLSFALSAWRDLGEVYPPAKKALLDTRDRATLQIEQGRGAPALFHDVAAINRTLGENAKTVRLFRELDKTNAAFAVRCWHYAKDAVFSEKQYDLAGKYVKDLLKEFDRVKAGYDMKVGMYGDPRFGGPSFKQFNENRFLEECLQLIELATANGDKKTAQEIRKRAASVVDIPIAEPKPSATSPTATNETEISETNDEKSPLPTKKR